MRKLFPLIFKTFVSHSPVPFLNVSERKGNNATVLLPNFIHEIYLFLMPRAWAVLETKRWCFYTSNRCLCAAQILQEWLKLYGVRAKFAEETEIYDGSPAWSHDVCPSQQPESKLIDFTRLIRTCPPTPSDGDHHYDLHDEQHSLNSLERVLWKRNRLCSGEWQVPSILVRSYSSVSSF